MTSAKAAAAARQTAAAGPSWPGRAGRGQKLVQQTGIGIDGHKLSQMPSCHPRTTRETRIGPVRVSASASGFPGGPAPRGRPRSSPPRPRRARRSRPASPSGADGELQPGPAASTGASRRSRTAGSCSSSSSCAPPEREAIALAAMTLSSPQHLVGLAHERGGSLRLTQDADSPSPLDRRPAEGLFCCPKTASHPCSTPISSPRSGPTSACAATAARASCSSRSSRAGSAATRSSAAARGCSTYEEAERCGEPVVGYLAYDFVAKLEPTVPLPDDGRGLPESRFVVADTLVRFDHVRGVAEVLRGDAGEVAALLEGDAAAPAARVGRGAPRRSASLRRPTTRRGVERVQGAHPAGRRVPDRALAARRAADDGVSALALYRVAAPRQPVAVPLPARARRHRARRLVARDARQVRGHARVAQPDRRLDAARRGRRRAAARLREGPRRARDARRPRPQRPLARLRARAR